MRFLGFMGLFSFSNFAKQSKVEKKSAQAGPDSRACEVI